MRRRLFIALACALTAVGCHAPPQVERILYVTTIHPLGAILTELVGDRGEVKVLLPPAASPHTYDPRPSDAMAAESALAVFYVAEDIDGWAARLPAKARFAVFSYVPNADRLVYEEHGGHDDHADDGHVHTSGYNGHFWSDPRIVNEMLPALAGKLTELDPAGLEVYRYNASRFSAELSELDRKMTAMFAGLEDRPVLMFHPSWDYFMHRYKLAVAGMVEPFPGKEPTPRYVDELVAKAKAQDVRAVFTEPQLPKRPAQAIAEACNLPLFEIDPNGGVEGRKTYVELIEYNAGMLKKAIE